MRRRKKRDIIIELTSLLDVIMIMIFMVMAENAKLTAQTADDLEQVKLENTALADENAYLSGELSEALGKLEEGDREELANKLHSAQNQLLGYEYMNEIVKVVNVTLENRYSDSVRYLSFGDASKPDTLKTIESRTDEEFKIAERRLRIFLSDFLSEVLPETSAPQTGEDAVMVYIIFSYDPKNVFLGDYKAVEQALRDAEIKSENGNIRYRFNKINK